MNLRDLGRMLQEIDFQIDEKQLDELFLLLDT